MAPALQTTDPTTHQFAQSHPNPHVVPIYDGMYGNHATVVDGDDTDAGGDPSAVMRKLMKGKDKEWDAVASTKSSGKQLTLLELPITHTNDLTSLALTNSNLHNLAIPHIYSRFDIVWPDATQMNTSDSKSVDALTYGLSTICLGSSFAHRTRKMLHPTYNMANPLPFKRRPKNDYAKYTRKFSLGNGPTDWVAEYMISKESGKMLGTLVALAVEKMINLETFVWDMPTGVLSDIFMALASVPEHSPDGESKLEKVWVRWHDNYEGTTSSSSSSPPPQHPAVSGGSNMTAIGYLIPSGAAHPAARPALPYAETRVEFPTFCVLPPLKSLTVLDIDELAYLDEMAIVIERSKDRLQELRVGISPKAVHKDFVQPWDGPGLYQIDRDARWPGESSIGDRRLGGVLGVEKTPLSSAPTMQPIDHSVADVDDTETLSASEPIEHTEADHDQEGPADDATEVGSEHQPMDNSTETAATGVEQSHEPSATEPRFEQQHSAATDKTAEPTCTSPRKRLDGKLKLRTLELERVNLSIQVCIQAFDWTVLTNITILDCYQSEHLWKGLRRQFAPTPTSRPGSHSTASHKQPMEYHLCLKSIHTNTVSNALISFLRDTLAPNSLEVLFLQDRRRLGSQPVLIEQVFKGVIKKHRSSLQKVLLDSTDRQHGNAATDSARWRNWLLTTDMLLYITSGRMSSLRELAISLHYRDWHTFLQRLPNIPHLRSLNLQHVAEHIVGTFEPRELALQMVDIITLRPEIQLCYVGIATKCFEILESKPAEESNISIASVTVDHTILAHDSGVDDEDDEDDNVGTDEETASQEDEETSEEEDDDDDDTPASAVDADDTQSEASAAQDSDDESLRDADHGPSRPRLRLREILFYDDKVAIFKARHGRL
ncbi:F-box domain-containing protein [Colletotrichum karsti]|uniref:F-box domain-containing protein n=1 Tax=Colletotrichum karsti TaxID=1095194 RepID=A0A9P6LMN5_9PEZI|nr:F-box domain-containing protein [Colletotrichum karsti]KAF9879013.1 F-box domain-containing protein [Colletotrichum karsti]